MTSSIENLFVTPPGAEAAKLTSRIQMAENLGRDSIRAADGNVDIEDMHRRKVARDFEAVFVRMVMSKMKDTIPEGDMEDSASKEIKNIYWTFLGDGVAEKGGFGMWKQIYESMPKNEQPQDVNHNKLDANV